MKMFFALVGLCMSLYSFARSGPGNSCLTGPESIYGAVGVTKEHGVENAQYSFDQIPNNLGSAGRL
jgi:hypothetical protein